jgi:dihydrofolate synthase/folylpolyglutamate synthase
MRTDHETEALMNTHPFSSAMSYSELTNWMFNLERFGIKLGLDNVTEFMKRIGEPQNDFKSVHVTGTNGKGSVCVMVAEILRRHGLKVGLYTSPHLVDFRERILVNGEQIPEADVVRIATDLRTAMETMASESKEKQLTFFEFTTGLAFRFFSEQKVDMVVAEVGLGGRLDATNVLHPEITAITRIGLEHTNYLGSTIPEIAREKAGIVKQGTQTVTCERGPEALNVIRSTCSRKGAALRVIGEDFEVSSVKQSLKGTSFDYSGAMKLRSLEMRLLGRYQAENAACALAIVEDLANRGIAISEKEIREGLRMTVWPGRLDVVSSKPLVILDGSHNPDGVKVTTSILKELKVTPLTYVIGCMDDKDVGAIVSSLVPTASKFVCTQTKNKRALPARRLAKVVTEAYSGQVEVYEQSELAFERAMKSPPGKGVCVIGSLYLVGEALSWWRSKRGSRSVPHKV